MLPTNKKIAVLHPYVNKKWWAVNMMIYLSDFLSNNNNDVTFYTFSYDNTIFPMKNRVISFNNSKLVSFFKIAYRIRDNDFIIIGNSPMHFVWVFSKILFGSKAKLIWWHHHYPWYYGWNTNVNILLKRFIEKIFLKHIDIVIANSKYLQESIKDIYKIDSKILYPVLDNKFLNYNSENKNKNDHPQPLLTKEGSRPKVIFTYGRWVFGKNIELIFNTYENLKNEIRELVLIIWWEWDELNKYKNKYKDDKNVVFLWIIDKDQIIKTLEKSTIVLFPSKIDSFWLVILESMSIWVPVLSYNIAWAKEIIKNWVNWYLLDSQKEFIDKTNEILNNSSLQNSLSIAAINTASVFSIDSFKNQLSEIFDTIKN